MNTRYVRIRRPDGSPRVGRLVDDDSIDVLDHDDPLAALSGAGRVVERIRLLQAENMPDYGRSIVYGVTILGIVLLFGGKEKAT